MYIKVPFLILNSNIKLCIQSKYHLYMMFIAYMNKLQIVVH